MTQLPPSPETSSFAVSALPEPLSLGTPQSNNSGTRLCSIAKYRSFRPQAIACSSITSSYFSEQVDFEAPRFLGSQNSQRHKDASSSFGAIAGSNGVALFRMSRPQTPLLILSHASSTNSEVGSIKTLAFEPKSQNAPLLAAARGSGVLIWDASGHSLSPLLGRLGADVTAVDSSDTTIKTLAWIKDSGRPLLAVANSASASVWDLRICLGSKTSRPALRFGNSQTGSPPLSQMASATTDECATLDASGVVRVFDLRIAGPRGKGAARTLCTFAAHQYGGVGLTAMKREDDETNWITWGLDEPHTDAAVRVWSTKGKALQQERDSNLPTDYWFMDGSPDQSPLESSGAGSLNTAVGSIHLVAQLTTPGLACARVCPDVFGDLKDHIVTVSTKTNGEYSGWRADVWKLNITDEDLTFDTATNHGATNIMSCGTDAGHGQLSWTIGNLNLGALIGAELAVSVPQARHDAEDIDENKKDLLLCCLTDSGYVTTTSMMTKTLKATAAGKTRKDQLWPTGTVHPIDPWAGSLSDAATAMHSFGDKHRQSNKGLLHEFVNPLSPKKTTERETDRNSQDVQLRGNDFGGMQFDLDDPALNPAGIGPIGVNAAIVSTGDQVVETTEDVMQKRAEVINKINTRDVPCPRLCGASFCPGTGGLICFRNGGVQTMWSWYQQTASHKSSILGFSPLLSKDSQFSVNEHTSQKAPRTLKDLIDMVAASKEAQWGQDDDSAGVDASDSDIDSLYDYDDSSDEGGEESDDCRDIYGKYFGGRQRPISVPVHSPKIKSDATSSRSPQESKDKPVASRKFSSAIDGQLNRPSMDLLSPIVSMTHDDNYLFNGQSPELAERFLLGDWLITPFQKTDPQEVLFHSSTHLGSSESPTRAGDFRSIMPRMQRFPSLTLDSLSDARSNLGNVAPSYTVASEEAVHGGEYSVRPSRLESLVIFKKLFTHQQDGPSYQNIVSPPDAPMLPKTMRPNSANAMMQTAVPSVETQLKRNTPLGIILLNPEKESKEREIYLEKMLGSIKLICIHNSGVCRDVGQEDKANVWSLLAETVGNQVKNESDSFSGWGGSSGGALGRELVLNLLNFYEAVGDVQMLSTMICVLSGGQRRVGNGERDPAYLLPHDHDAKYDLVMRRYSDILYGWGLLTVRAELIKHIVHQMPTTDFFEIAPALVDEDGHRAPGIGLYFRCSKCGGEAKPGTNVCSICRDFAFRCSICDHAVRGLFTVCDKCGHGGHVNHMTSWFSNHSVCPTGCGCLCASGPHASSPATPTPMESTPEESIIGAPFHDYLESFRD